MKLYELSEEFNCLFDEFDDINNFTPDTDADGNYIDYCGNIIPDLEAYREKLRSAWFDTLSAIEEEFNIKAESFAVYIKSVGGEIEMIKKEEKALKERRAGLENSVSSMKRYLLSAMKDMGLKKIDTPRARMSVRSNAESLVIDDEIAFIQWAQENDDSLLKYSMPEIRKTDTKKLLKSGQDVPFVHLTRTESLTIK